MRQILITTFLTLLFFNKTLACLNGETTMLKDGTFLFEDRKGHVPYGHIFLDDDWFEDGLKRVDKLYKSTKTLTTFQTKGCY